ncbi:MAG: hypothetical protein QXW31_05680 [Nitrososphaerota archaeon]
MRKRVYKVVLCKNCGHIQITYAENSYQCFRCGTIMELESSKIIFRTLDLKKAKEKLIALKSIKQPEFKKLSGR